MNIDITDITWNEICNEAHLVTNSTSCREIKWKVLMKFWTPAVLAKMGPVSSNSCWRNCGTQIHTLIFWASAKLRIFREEVFKVLEMIFPKELTKEPTVAILGITPIGIDGRAKNIVYEYF